MKIIYIQLTPTERGIGIGIGIGGLGIIYPVMTRTLTLRITGGR